MPKWDNQPPKDCQRAAFRLIRTPTAKPLQGYVISHELTGCPTHYIGNRTVPCESPNCQACENGVGWRWHGYLLVYLDTVSEIIIFEMTAISSRAFKEYYERYATLRGCAFKAERQNGRPNGRVLIQTKPGDMTRVNLPEDMDIRKLLCHIWNIAPNQLDDDPPNPRPPAKTIRIDRSKPEVPDPTLRPTQAHRDFVHANKITKTPGGNGRGSYPDTFPELPGSGV